MFAGRGLLRGTAAPADILAEAGLDATNLDLQFPREHYGIRCQRLRASVPGSELIAEETELRPINGDEAFFAAHAFRTPRFHVVVPECKVVGLAYGDALRGKSSRAQSAHFSRPSFEAMINRDKPPAPFVRSPLMVHEALALPIRPLLQVDRLSITNGHFKYCERLAVGADPAVLTFAAVSLWVEGIANRGEPTAAIQLRGQGDLMEAGTMKVRMSIPIMPPDFSLHYSGSLSAMDLTRLDAFLGTAEHTRIKSGSAQEAAFEIDVAAGQARGHVRAIYKDLEITVLGKQTGVRKGARQPRRLDPGEPAENPKLQHSGRIWLDEGGEGGGRAEDRTRRFSNLRGLRCGPGFWMSSAIDGMAQESLPEGFRQAKRKPGPAPRRAFAGHRARHRLHEFLDDAQAQPGRRGSFSRAAARESRP